MISRHLGLWIMALRSIDLFAGSGGMTHALRGVATPIIYCENEPTRIATLTQLMTKGLLPTAPIHDDIRTLQPPSTHTLDLVMGGWPCRGWSVVGKHQGFGHEQSALFFEFARVVNNIKPPLIFQENVPAVSFEAPLKAIAEALPDYDLVWMVMPAYTVGSPQYRRRWYCLGIRKDIEHLTLDIQPNVYTKHDFLPERVPRMIATRQPTARLSMMGNAVVPDAARLAFLMLFTGFTMPPAALWMASTVELQRPLRKGTPLGKDPARRRYGSWMHGTFERHTLHFTMPGPMDLDILLVPTAYTPTRDRKASADNMLCEPKKYALWASPRGANVGASISLTHRSVRDIYTQLRFERSTPDDIRDGHPNPEWIETHLMGYPPGWTEFIAPVPTTEMESS